MSEAAELYGRFTAHKEKFMTSPKKKMMERNGVPVIVRMMEEKPELVDKYEAYLKEHQKRLRRLEREARGESVPGDYDEGY